MLNKLFKQKNTKFPKIPEGTRIYAIGDIHGSLTELDSLLELIKQDVESTEFADKHFEPQDAANIMATKLVFLGDYVDRGPDSKGVIDRLLHLQTSETDVLFLKGNHEAAMLDFITTPQKIPEWLHWGGAETLESYGLTNVWSREETDLSAELNDVMPTAHLNFLKSLKLTYQSGDFLFVHAGLKPGIPIDEQTEKDLLWIRGEFHKMSANQRPEKVVVHGHHPIKSAKDEGWRINVDTGACWSGSLTAVVLDGTKRRFISTENMGK